MWFSHNINSTLAVVVGQAAPALPDGMPRALLVK